MKRILTLMAAALLIFGVAGTASAGFIQGTFVSSVNDGTSELFAGLGYAYDGLDETTVNNFFDIDADFTAAGGSYANLTFGGATGDVNGTNFEYYDIWVAVSGTPTIDAGYFGGVQASSQAAVTAAAGTGDVQVPAGTQGYLGTLGTQVQGAVGSAGTIDLGAFDSWTAGQEITLSMDIWHFADDFYGLNGWMTQEDTGYDLAITRYADGSISTAIVNPVPVPGALILLGSGLMALIGVRRKNS